MSDIGRVADEQTKAMTKEVLDHCSGRLDKDELAKLRRILDDHQRDQNDAIEAEVTAKGWGGGASSAMDGFNPRRTAGQVVSDMRRAEAAKRPVIGDAVLACDSAEEMYRRGLMALGTKTQGIPSRDLEGGFVAVQRVSGGAHSRSSLSAGEADFNRHFPSAVKLARR